MFNASDTGSHSRMDNNKYRNPEDLFIFLFHDLDNLIIELKKITCLFDYNFNLLLCNINYDLINSLRDLKLVEIQDNNVSLDFLDNIILKNVNVYGGYFKVFNQGFMDLFFFWVKEYGILKTSILKSTYLSIFIRFLLMYI